jgi:thiol-disulfide isomerase/thioredoxin
MIYSTYKKSCPTHYLGKNNKMKKIMLAHWGCVPCQTLKPIFLKVSTEIADVIFEEVDCNENPEIPRFLGGKGTCIVLLFDENNMKLKAGMISEQFKTL